MLSVSKLFFYKENLLVENLTEHEDRLTRFFLLFLLLHLLGLPHHAVFGEDAFILADFENIIGDLVNLDAFLGLTKFVE